MRKLPDRITYDVRCDNCGHIETYICRQGNVNPMSDKDVMYVVRNTIGNIEQGDCDGCGMYTSNKRVAFNLTGDLPINNKTEGEHEDE